MVEAAATTRQKSGNLEPIRQFLLRLCRFDLKSMNLRLNICSKLARDTIFFQNTSVVFIDFQTDRLRWSAALQGSSSDIQLLENKSLLRSLIPSEEVSAWSFSALCI